MPVAPSYLDKVNYIVEFWTDPCNAPVLVYLELAKEPLGDAILMWLTFGLADIFRGFARPNRALGGRPTTRRGKPRPKKHRIPAQVRRAGRAISRLPGIGDDVGGWIGKNIPGAQTVKGRKVSQGQKFFWILDDMGQQVLLALLIADIGIDFLYDWATLIDATEYCQRQSRGSLYATGPGTPVGGIIGCRQGDAPNVLWKEGNCDWRTSMAFVGPRGWQCISTMELRNISAWPIQHWQQALVSDVTGVRMVFSETQIIPASSNFQSVHSFGIVGPGNAVINHCAFGGFVTSTAHDAAVFGGGA